MQKILLGLVLYFGMMVASAFPILTWTWVAPLLYGNGVSIPASDVLSYNLYCGNDGVSFSDTIVFSSSTPPSVEDMAFAVKGTPGTYACAATAVSSEWNSESDFSEIVTFTVTPADLGFIPNPPTLLSVQ